jgi:hypothetical protein
MIGRKLLAPLIKRIHPDLFTKETQTIRSLNLTCLQTLNELWDNLERLHTHIVSYNNNNIKSTKQLPISFKQKYHLSCYIRDNGNNNDGNDNNDNNDNNETILKKIDAVIISPIELCKKEEMNNQQITKVSVMKMHRQLGRFFIKTGLTNPWSIMDNNDSNDTFDGDTVCISSSQMIIDTQAFQRDIELKYRMAHATLFNTNDSNSKSSINNSSKRSRMKMMPISWHLLRGEADAFIRNGNVLVTNVSPREELESIERLREFLIEYGALLNFRIDKWQMVVVVIGGTKGYSYEMKVGRHVISIPPNFKEVQLFECLRRYLPMARLFSL